MENQSLEVPKGRVVSIDALRGFDMFWIIGGGTLFLNLFKLSDNPVFNTLANQLEHSRWHGFTFEDLIFPLFLFIVGLSMPFALTKRIDRGESKKDLYIHIIKRTLVLLALGLVYNGFLKFNFEMMRWTGVLQRIAICYFLSALIVMNTRLRGQAVWAGSILVVYWAVMKLVPVPGFGAGDLSPEGNLAGYIDRLFLPGRFCCYKFGDNEGILSMIPAVSTTLLGVLTGHWIRTPEAGKKKVHGMLLAGVASLVVALLWHLVFPINKLFWSSLYVLFAGGWSLLLFAAFYWIVDVKGYKKWAFPFIVIGLNPITIYVAQGVFDFGAVANIFVQGFIDDLGVMKPLVWTLCVLIVKWLFLYFLYRQKIFLKA